MKSVLLMLSLAATLVAASPATACRVRTAPQPPLTPPRADLIVFTATIDQRWAGAGRPGAELRVSRTFAGDPGDRVDATWTGRQYTNDTIDGVAGELIIFSCAVAAIYQDALYSLPMGTELMVMARRTPEGVDVQDLAPMDSPRGRELRALANP